MNLSRRSWWCQTLRQWDSLFAACAHGLAWVAQSLGRTVAYRSRPRASRPRYHLVLEGLETRLVPSWTPTVTVTDSGGPYDGQPYAATPLVAGIDGVSGPSLEGVSVNVVYFDTSWNLLAGAPTDAGDYLVHAEFPGSTDYDQANAWASFTITPAPLTVSASVPDKVYDGTTDATIGSLTLSGVSGNDDVSATADSASFASKDVGTGIVVTVSGLALTGAQAQDYSLPSDSVATTAAITPAPLTVAATAADKVYDGTTAATVTSLNLAGVIGTDDVSVSAASASFDTKDVGSGKTVTVAGLALAGSDASDYMVAGDPVYTTADITPATVNVAASASDKTYDGGTGDDSVTLTLVGLFGNDSVSVTFTNSDFDTKDVGTGKTVTISGLGLTGADAQDYTLASDPIYTTAAINPLTLTVIATAADKVYDGTTGATVTSVNWTGVIGNDDVSVSGGGSGSFDTPNVGTGKTVTITGLVLSGNDAEDYALPNPVTTTADITPAGPTMNNPGDQANLEFDTVSLQLSASDPNATIVSYNLSDQLPPGLSFNSSTGLISGAVADYAIPTPGVPAGQFWFVPNDSVYNLSVTATDSLGLVSAPQTFTWTVQAPDPTLWTDPANWWNNSLPGAADNVYVDPNVSVSLINAPGPVDINSLHFSGLTLNVGGAFTVGTMDFTAGMLNVTGTLTVTDTADLGSSTEAPSIINIAPGGQLILSGAGDKLLEGATINNQGTLTWAGGTIDGPGLLLNNEAGATFDMQSDDTWLDSTGTSTVNNTGTVQKSGGGGTSTIDATYNDDGTTDGQIGTLALSSGGLLQGAAQAAGGAAVGFAAGTFSLLPGFTFSGNGVLIQGLSNGQPISLVIGSNVPVTNFQLAAGTLDGPGNLVLTGNNSQWTGGTMQGTGTTTIQAGATLTVASPTATKQIDRVLQNLGIVNYNLGTWRLQGSATITNIGQLNINTGPNANSSILGADETGVLTNSGQIAVTGGARATLRISQASNDGQITVGAGTTLRLSGVRSQNAVKQLERNLLMLLALVAWAARW